MFLIFIIYSYKLNNYYHCINTCISLKRSSCLRNRATSVRNFSNCWVVSFKVAVFSANSCSRKSTKCLTFANSWVWKFSICSLSSLCSTNFFCNAKNVNNTLIPFQIYKYHTYLLNTLMTLLMYQSV